MKNRKGFTLVELLAVIVILAIIVVIVSTKGFGVLDNAKVAINEQDMKTLKEAAKLLGVEIQNCVEEINDFYHDEELKQILKIQGKIPNDQANLDCATLKKAANDCFDITKTYLLEKKYATGSNLDKIDMPDDKVAKICIDNGKVKIELPIEQDNEEIVDEIEQDDANEPEIVEEDMVFIDFNMPKEIDYYMPASRDVYNFYNYANKIKKGEVFTYLLLSSPNMNVILRDEEIKNSIYNDLVNSISSNCLKNENKPDSESLECINKKIVESFINNEVKTRKGKLYYDTPKDYFTITRNGKNIKPKKVINNTEKARMDYFMPDTGEYLFSSSAYLDNNGDLLYKYFINSEYIVWPSKWVVKDDKKYVTFYGNQEYEGGDENDNFYFISEHSEKEHLGWSTKINLIDNSHSVLIRGYNMYFFVDDVCGGINYIPMTLEEFKSNARDYVSGYPSYNIKRYNNIDEYMYSMIKGDNFFDNAKGFFYSIGPISSLYYTYLPKINNNNWYSNLTFFPYESNLLNFKYNENIGEFYLQTYGMDYIYPEVGVTFYIDYKRFSGDCVSYDYDYDNDYDYGYDYEEEDSYQSSVCDIPGWCFHNWVVNQDTTMDQWNDSYNN